MKKLSVVLATYNEEKNIGKCLESVKDLADEIIIVDGSSSDRTVEIAREHGAKVTVTTNHPIFHINKQKALDLAKNEWILQLDADETVSKELSDEIQQILNMNDSEIDAYQSRLKNKSLFVRHTQLIEKRDGRVGTEENMYGAFFIPRKNYFLGRYLMHGGVYPDGVIRLVKQGKARFPAKSVHEQIVIEGKVGWLANDLIHMDSPTFSKYLMRWNRYTSLIAEDIRRENEHKNLFQKFLTAIGYLFLRPSHWLLTTYIRHKGFMDSWQGFVFSFFSALRFPAAYLFYLNKDEKEDDEKGGLSRFFNRHFILITFLIIFIAFFLRFYNFSGRWGLGGDDARDIAIAQEAIKRMSLPLIGSFSSAGPFVFGPLFYWVLMASFLLIPHTLYAPWIVTGIVGVLTVLVIMLVAKQVGGKRLALLAGLLAAFSPQLVIRSMIVGQHTYIGMLAALTLLFYILFWKTKNFVYSFFTGIAIGTAISFHYQALNLIIFFPFLLIAPIISIRKKIVSLVLAGFGFLIPSLPLLWWDARQGFANTRNILDYFLIGQYRIYVPNSWKLFIFNYFPDYWSFVTGGVSIIALILMFLVGVVFLYGLIKRKVPGVLLTLAAIMVLLATLNRYYRGERSEGYMLYFSPFIILFSAWVFNEFIFSNLKNTIYRNISIVFGTALLFVVLAFNIIKIIPSYGNSVMTPLLYRAVHNLSAKYPGKTFTIYDYDFKTYNGSTALSVLMSNMNLSSSGGIKIGLVCYARSYKQIHPVLVNTGWGCPLVDLRGLNSGQLRKLHWFNASQEGLYDDLITRWETHQLRSTFSLIKFLMRR